jgi:hypothetical protein
LLLSQQSFSHFSAQACVHSINVSFFLTGFPSEALTAVTDNNDTVKMEKSIFFILLELDVIKFD